MKKYLLASAAILAVSASAASAADLAARPYTKAPAMIAAVYDWSGFYLGANAGYGTSRDCRTNLTTLAFPGCHDADGAVAGGQIGYRWQSSAWVFGLEAQGNWADLKGSNVNAFNGANLVRSKLDAFGLFTGQVGYAWNNTLLYVKGGAAVTSNSYDFLSITGATNGLVVSAGSDRSRWSGTAGVGLEYGFTPNWSLAVEYDHIFQGGNTITFANANNTTTPYRTGGDVDLVTARINYRFGGPVVAKY